MEMLIGDLFLFCPSSNITGCYLEFPSSLFENVSPEAVDLIRQLLVIEPK